MGTVFQLRIVHARSLSETLRETKQRFGTRVVATHLAGGRTIQGVDLSGNVCIVLGNEERGVSEETLAVCDERVVVPMSAGVDSLNVASASAVFLYEARRQRTR